MKEKINALLALLVWGAAFPLFAQLPVYLDDSMPVEEA